MTFQRRIEMGTEHERSVASALAERGWLVTPFGQGLLPEATRSLLRDRATPLRWLPDLVAAREHVVLVEAKSGHAWKKTGNHIIELDCLASMLLHKYIYSVQTFIVWPDFTVNEPDRLEPIKWELHPGEWAQGSHTPYALVRCRDQRAFDDVFGVPKAGAA